MSKDGTNNKFQAKWPSYGHPHAIVCDKVSIFDIEVCLGMANIVAKNNFNISFINIIFHVLSAKNDFFYQASTKNMLQKGTHISFTNSSTYLMDNAQVLGIFSIYT